MISLQCSGILSRLFLPQRLLTDHYGTLNYADKIIVANLPKFMRVNGATGEKITEDIDLSAKTCLITGGTNGIGAEIVRVLMKRNCKVVMACRNPYKAQSLAKKWENSENLSSYKVDLGSLTSVKKVSEEILNKEKKFDFVILNAAIFGIPWTLTEDRFETTVQVNYLSQYYLLMNIQRLLTDEARVVLMSSESHRYVKWSPQEIESPTKETISIPNYGYSSIKAYNVSKICGLLAINNLGYRWSQTNRTLLAAHPGSFVKTNLCSNWWVYEALYTMCKPFSKSIAQAAATPLFCVTRPELQNHSVVYFKDCKECVPSPLARDNYLAFRISDLTDRLLDETIGFIEEKVGSPMANQTQMLETEATKETSSFEETEIEEKQIEETEATKETLYFKETEIKEKDEQKEQEQKVPLQEKSRNVEQQVVSA